MRSIIVAAAAASLFGTDVFARAEPETVNLVNSRAFPNRSRRQPTPTTPTLANISTSHPDYGMSPTEHARAKAARS